MKNPIQKNPMYSTPKQFSEVLDVVNRIPDNGAIIAVSMAVNFCARLADIHLMPLAKSRLGDFSEQRRAVRLLLEHRVPIAKALERGICGDFAKGLGKSLIHADTGNLGLIAQTWPDIIIQAHRLAVDK